MKDNESLPPSLSLRLLKNVVGKRVTGLIRYSWWPKEEVSNECGTAEGSAFSLTYGPLGVAFEDGTVIGIAEEPSINSVVVWLDRAVGIAAKHPAMDEDSELFPIDVKDRQFSNKLFFELVGRTLINLVVLKPRSMNALLSELPSEIGLCFVFEGGQRFIAARGLHQVGGDFAVIAYEQIPTPIREEIVECPLI
ncbi:hypothetical protein [Rugamonas sp. DEMB1]|uniref:hypothetical protein n=1 Tax=Rugamonas sp. DEMB1 TaxID=3039386 RepID=UPI00244B12C4|nr:hypothetical protein [Rugamonas sp. DEMB1]WGG52842.1 hypothetical protein QC826_12265 [Rugamonas sp. DEMB1]